MAIFTLAMLNLSVLTLAKDSLPITDFTVEAVKVYAKIQAYCVKTGKTSPVFDLLIASTAIANNLILVTIKILRIFRD